MSDTELQSLRAERDRLSVDNIRLYEIVGECLSLVRTNREAHEKVMPLFLEALENMGNSPINLAVSSVVAGCRKQDAKWGEQNHRPALWSAILTEECGEFAQAALETELGGPNAHKLRDEAVDVAAVAVQIIEWIDRHNSPQQPNEMREAA